MCFLHWIAFVSFVIQTAERVLAPKDTTLATYTWHKKTGRKTSVTLYENNVKKLMPKPLWSVSKG